jgi:hypothetical protein
MGTNPQKDPHSVRELSSHDLKVGVSHTISAHRITGSRNCNETENSESYGRCQFRRVRKVAKSAYYLPHFRPSVRLIACIIGAPTARISVKFGTGGVL